MAEMDPAPVQHCGGQSFNWPPTCVYRFTPNFHPDYPRLSLLPLSFLYPTGCLSSPSFLLSKLCPSRLKSSTNSPFASICTNSARLTKTRRSNLSLFVDCFPKSHSKFSLKMLSSLSEYPPPWSFVSIHLYLTASEEYLKYAITHSHMQLMPAKRRTMPQTMTLKGRSGSWNIMA